MPLKRNITPIQPSNAPLIQIRYFRRVHNIENRHDEEHQYRVKDKQENLVPQQVPVIPLQILDNAENTSYHDQTRRNVQNVHMSLPRQPRIWLQRRMQSRQSPMKQPRHNDKEPKKRKLQKQSRDNNLLSRMKQCQRPRSLDPTTTHLRQETDHVARYEDLREVLLTDQGVLFAVDEQDDAAEDDVDGGCEEGGREEEEQGLHYEGAEGPEVGGGEDAAYEAYYFD